jgi:glycosyltransferase involved in cell wall biosynthesis
VRIAFVVESWPRLPSRGHLREVAAAAARHDVRVLALAPSLPGPVEPEAEALAGRLTSLDAVPSGRRTATLRALRHPGRFRLALRVARGARAEGSVRRLPSLTAAAEALRREGVERVHAQSPGAPAAVAEVVSAWTGAPFGLSLDAHDAFAGAPRLAEKAAASSWGVARSRTALDEVARRHGAATAARFELVRPGVDLSEWTPGPGRDASGPLRVLAAGDCVARAGFDVLVEALARMVLDGKPVTARLVGDGPLLKGLRSQAATAGAGAAIAFEGARPASELRREMRTWAHVAVLPSRVDAAGDRDGLPDALEEAMACGLPVVGTPVGGLPEALEDGKTGLVVEPDESAGLAAALARLAKDHDLCRRLGDGARARAEALFDGAENAARFLSLVEAGRRQ